MPVYLTEDGDEVEYEGFPLDEADWYVSIHGQWTTHSSFISVSATDDYQHALKTYRKLQDVGHSCGVSYLMTRGNQVVAPDYLYDKGNP